MAEKKTYSAPSAEVKNKKVLTGDLRSNAQRERDSKKSITNIFSIVIIILLLACLLSFFTGNGEMKTFYGFLQNMAEAPEIPTDWITIFELNTSSWGDWGVFEFFKVFLEILADMVSVVGFIGTGVLQALVFIVYILRWLFL